MRSCAIFAVAPCPPAMDCTGCVDEWNERAAIIEHGQGTGPDACVRPGRPEAERLAREMLRPRIFAGEQLRLTG